jgi:hypothetical protein
MPSVEFDIKDHVANLIDTAIKSGGPGDFNPGQQVAWDAVECNINRATLIVNIAGKDVDVETDIDVSCTGADYISQAVAELQETANAMGGSVYAFRPSTIGSSSSGIGSTIGNNDILDTKKYIDEAFKSL